MNRLLIGLIFATLLIVAGFYFFADRGFNGSSDSAQSVDTDAIIIKRCAASDVECLSYKSKYRGISGSARLGANSHLVVHDLHTGPKQVRRNRLGIINRSSDGSYTYYPVSIDMAAWHRSGKTSDDLESACRLTGNEILVAESGRTDTRINGEISRQDWLGRIFHLQLNFSGKDSTAIVFDVPELRLPQVSVPQFTAADPDIDEFPHSKENFEGLACIRLNPDSVEAAKFLVVAGERGGKGTLTGTLHWGEYDTAQPLSIRKIEWMTATDVGGIVAPGKGRHSDAEWRDITGLHIDARHRLFATAAYDSQVDHPPYGSVLYQLGIICVDPADTHEKTALCDYKSPARPVVLGTYSVLAATDHHKIETVAAPSGHSPGKDNLSVGAEDEDGGGVWWPRIPD